MEWQNPVLASEAQEREVCKDSVARCGGVTCFSFEWIYCMSHEELARKALSKHCVLGSVLLRRSQDDLKLFRWGKYYSKVCCFKGRTWTCSYDCGEAAVKLHWQRDACMSRIVKYQSKTKYLSGSSSCKLLLSQVAKTLYATVILG